VSSECFCKQKNKLPNVGETFSQVFNWVGIIIYLTIGHFDSLVFAVSVNRINSKNFLFREYKLLPSLLKEKN